MKPASFTYHDPVSIGDVVDLLCRHENARLLAGGQSLMPMMNYRIVQPDHLIDLGRIPELAFLENSPDGLKVGAMTTQRTIERSDVVRERCPLLTDALLHVGHQQTRNRGTIGGSLAHADPAADWISALSALNAEVEIASRARKRRRIALGEFVRGALDVALKRRRQRDGQAIEIGREHQPPDLDGEVAAAVDDRHDGDAWADAEKVG